MNTCAWGVDTHTHRLTPFHRHWSPGNLQEPQGSGPPSQGSGMLFQTQAVEKAAPVDVGSPALQLIAVCWGWWGYRHTVQHRISRKRTQNSLVTLSSLQCPEMPTSDGPGGPHPFLAATSLRIRCREIASLAVPSARAPSPPVYARRAAEVHLCLLPNQGLHVHASPSLKSIKSLLHWGISSHQGPTFF